MVIMAFSRRNTLLEVEINSLCITAFDVEGEVAGLGDAVEHEGRLTVHDVAMPAIALEHQQISITEFFLSWHCNLVQILS